jgi:hypothetical protein
MALQLFRLASVTPVTTNTNYAYFRMPLSESINVAATDSYTLRRSTWYYGNGNTVTGYVTATGYNLCINGVLQQSGLYTVAVGSSVKLIAPAGGLSIPEGAVITLQALNTSITPTTVAVP